MRIEKAPGTTGMVGWFINSKLTLFRLLPSSLPPRCGVQLRDVSCEPAHIWLVLLLIVQRRESSSARDVEQSDEDLQGGAREAEASFAHVLANGGRVKVRHRNSLPS